MMIVSPALVAIVAVVLYLLTSIKILAEYERGVIFRLGKLQAQPKGPGIILVLAPIDRMVRVSLRTVVLDVPPQDIITRDNVSVKVNAVVFFRVIDPRLAILEVENFHYATSQLAQTTLRSVLGQAELDDLLAERERLNQDLQRILDKQTDPWGVKVSAVEVKHVDLPADMQRAIAKQAEAEREKRAKIIHAEGELSASEKLAQAAAVINREPLAITLRYLQTLTEISAEKNSTIIFPAADRPAARHQGVGPLRHGVTQARRRHRDGDRNGRGGHREMTGMEGLASAIATLTRPENRSIVGSSPSIQGGPRGTHTHPSDRCGCAGPWRRTRRRRGSHSLGIPREHHGRVLTQRRDVRALSAGGRSGHRRHHRSGRSRDVRPVPAGLFPVSVGERVGVHVRGQHRRPQLLPPEPRGRVQQRACAVNPAAGRLAFDNSLSEHLSGDIVGTSPAFRPHALDFGLTWPGVTFDSFDIPRSLPTSPVEGYFSLYLWTCSGVGDPGCVRQDTQVVGNLTSAVQVAEPATLASLALGLIGLVAARRHQGGVRRASHSS